MYDVTIFYVWCGGVLPVYEIERNRDVLLKIDIVNTFDNQKKKSEKILREVWEQWKWAKFKRKKKQSNLLDMTWEDWS